MDIRKLLLSMMLIFTISFAAAPATQIDVITSSYTDACADVTWTYTETTDANIDLNTWNITTASNVSVLNNLDYNVQTAATNLCTLADDDYIEFTITPIDSNMTPAGFGEGNFAHMLGAEKVARVEPAGSVGAGKYFAYVLMVTFAGIIGIVLLIFLVIMAMKKLQLQRLLSGLKR